MPRAASEAQRAVTRKGVLEEGSLLIPRGAIVPTPNSPGPEGGLPQLRLMLESARVLCAPMNRVRALGLRSITS